MRARRDARFSPSYIPHRMKVCVASCLVLVVSLACVPAGQIEEQNFELGQASRHNACNQQAWARCQGVADQDACVQREGLACDSQVDNTVDLDQEDPLPSGIEDSLPAEPR